MQSHTLTTFTDYPDLYSDGVLRNAYTITSNLHSSEVDQWKGVRTKYRAFDHFKTSNVTEAKPDAALAKLLLGVFENSWTILARGKDDERSRYSVRALPGTTYKPLNPNFLRNCKIAFNGLDVDRGAAGSLLTMLAGKYRTDVSDHGFDFFTTRRVESLTDLASATDVDEIDQDVLTVIEFMEGHGTGDVPTKLVATVLSKFENFARAAQYHKVDDVFTVVEVSRCPAAFLIAALRISFPFRGELSEWNDFRAAVRAELDQRGLESTKLLRGLA